MITNGVRITVEKTNESFHTKDDWGLAITNNNYIGNPEQQTSYVTVPGASIDIDLSESLTGRPTFKSRPINIELSAIYRKKDWDAVISDIRNHIEGKIVRLCFDNDLGFYWRGRVNVVNFDRLRNMGEFALSIPHADPFKYDVFDSQDEWEWDPFDFEEGIIRYFGTVEVSGSLTVNFPKGNMLVVPTFEVSKIISAMSFVFNGKTYNLKEGNNRFPDILVAGDEEKEITIQGNGTVKITYRGGSL